MKIVCIRKCIVDVQLDKNFSSMEIFSYNKSNPLFKCDFSLKWHYEEKKGNNEEHNDIFCIKWDKMV
jgi:hypothetical protein